MRGHIFNINGKKIFAMGGAYSHGGPYRQKWYPNQEMPSSFVIYKGLFTLNSNDNKVDYIITHTMPGTFLGYIAKRPYPEETRLLRFFDNIYRDVKFKRWFIGHYHIDKLLFEGRLTLDNDEDITIK